MAILKISDLDIGYLSKKKTIVVSKAINVTVKQPKFIALLGRNGVGKSTLLRTISKMQPSLQGQITIENKNIHAYNITDYSKKVSVVLTERIPPSHLTVYELIALGRQVYTNWIGTLSVDDKIKIEDALKLVNCIELKHQKIDELSDGQYQKVMIARALAQDTSIILLDEPTAHLDVVNKIEIFRILKQLVSKENKTIIISSHELQLAVQIVDDLWLMSAVGLVSGQTCDLIQNNALQNLFSSDSISFNKESNQFMFKS